MLPSRARTIVAAAVATVILTACGGDSGSEDGADAPAAAPGVLALTGTDELLWDVEELEAEAGTVSFALTCEGGVNHNLVIEETDEMVAQCEPGATVEGSVELDAGSYTYICNVPGHESRMIGQLTVA